MKTILLILATLSLSSIAGAQTQPVLDDYEKLAGRLVQDATVARDAEEVGLLIEETRQLVSFGTEIMKIYAEKNPACAEQFAVFLGEVPQMEFKTVEELHARYHNGQGLPTAPKHCYMGRSQVIHPMMNLVRLQNGALEAEREEIVHEYEEVVEHMEKVRRNLENPPN